MAFTGANVALTDSTSLAFAGGNATFNPGTQFIGAGRMVFGGFFVLGEDVQVNVRLVDTATTREGIVAAGANHQFCCAFTALPHKHCS